MSVLCGSRRTPERAAVEPVRISGEHRIVEHLRARCLFCELFEIKNVSVSRRDDPRTVIVALRVLVASNDHSRLARAASGTGQVSTAR